jgi:hypothetical protein
MAGTGGSRNIVIGESDQQALEWAMDPLGSNHYYFSYLWDVLQRANYTIVMRPDRATARGPFGVEDMINSMGCTAPPARSRRNWRPCATGSDRSRRC